MKTRKSISLRFRDYLLLILSSVLFLWGVNCFGPATEEQVGIADTSRQYGEGGGLVNVLRAAFPPRGSGSPTFRQDPDPLQITLAANGRWEESECSITWTVVDKGLVSVADLSEGSLLTLSGSDGDEAADMTTVHLEARPAGCLDSRLHSERVTIRIPIKFVIVTS